MSSLSPVIIFIIVVCFIIVLLAMLGYNRFIKKKPKTKENFAYFTICSILTLSTNYFSIIQGSNIFEKIFIQFLNLFSNKQINISEPSVYDKVLATFITTIIIFIIAYIYKNGAFKQSTIEAESIKIGKGRIGLFEGAKINYKILNKDLKIEIYHNQVQKEVEIFQSIENVKLPFHIQIGQLLNLYDQQYQIDLGDYEITKNNKGNNKIEFGNHWYGEQNCYIAHYGSENEKVGILCLENEPSIEELKKFKDFIESRTGKFHKILITSEVQIPKENQITHIGCYLVEYLHKEQLLKQLINFNNYEKCLNRNFYNDKLQNSDQTLNDIYTPLGASHCEIVNDEIAKGLNIKNVEKYIIDWVKSNKKENEHLAILGEYGQGKSVLSQKICIELLKDKNSSRIPIIIELRGISPRNMNVISLLGHFGNQYAITAQALYQLHIAGKLLIILEAFDEMDLVGDTEMLMSHFKQLWQLASTPKSKIIITGRPNLFIDDQKRRSALGINNTRDYLPYTHAIQLEPMSIYQIEKALRKSPATTCNQIISALKEVGLDSNFGELVRRPSTLYQLSTVWDKDFKEDGTDRINAAMVIDRFIQNDYDRQEAKFVSKNEKPVITSDERSYFMMGIAIGMMLKEGYSNQISNKQLLEIIKNLYNNYPRHLAPYRYSSEGLHTTNLLERLIENEHSIQTVISDVLASGILVLDLSGSDVFKFSHKSYLEYLVSRFYANFILEDNKDEYEAMIINSIKKTFDFKNNSLVHSSDVNNFIAQNISNRIIIKDKNGKILDLQQNKKPYTREIYKKIFPKLYSQIFPSLQSWLSFHPKLLRIQFLSTLLMFISMWDFKSIIKSNLSPLQIAVTICLIILYLISLGIFNKEKLSSPLDCSQNNFYQHRIELFKLTLNQLRIEKTSPYIANKVVSILKKKDNEFIVLLNDVKILKYGIVILFSIFLFSIFSLWCLVDFSNPKSILTYISFTSIIILTIAISPFITIFFPIFPNNMNMNAKLIKINKLNNLFDKGLMQTSLIIIFFFTEIFLQPISRTNSHSSGSTDWPLQIVSIFIYCFSMLIIFIFCYRIYKFTKKLKHI